jgi:hypothetical protein
MKIFIITHVSCSDMQSVLFYSVLEGLNRRGELEICACLGGEIRVDFSILSQMSLRKYRGMDPHSYVLYLCASCTSFFFSCIICGVMK